MIGRTVVLNAIILVLLVSLTNAQVQQQQHQQQRALHQDNNHHNVLLNDSAVSWKLKPTCSSSSSSSQQPDQQRQQMQNPTCVTADTAQSKPPVDDGMNNGDDANNMLLTQLREAVLRRCDEATNEQQQHQQQYQVCHDVLQDTAQLKRILIARQDDIEKAVDMVMEQVRFKIKWNPLHITPNMIPNALPSGAFRCCGYSKDGHVMVNFKLRYWNPKAYGVNHTTTTTAAATSLELHDNAIDQEHHDEQEHPDDHGLHDAVHEFVRYVVYMMELSLGYVQPPPMPDKLIVLFDLRGFSLSLVVLSRVRRMISRLIYIAQAQYPERLEKVYLLHAPFGFATAWQLVRPLLDERTAQKVQFAADVSKLEQDVDLSILSEDYGGTHPEYPLPSKTLEEEWNASKSNMKIGATT